VGRPRSSLVAALVTIMASVAPAHATEPFNPAHAVGAMCAGCHGDKLEGGRAPPLDRASLARFSDERLGAILANGVPGTEMGGFADALTDDERFRILSYLRTHAADQSARPATIADPDGQVVRSRKQAFRVEVLARGLDTPWGIAFLPDGRALVTERRGALRILDRRGRLLPEAVVGTPKVWVRQDAGMLDVAVPPGQRKRPWIYLAYADALREAVGDASPPSMTVVIRGKLDGANRWTDTQELFRAPPGLYTPSGSHYGARFLFDRAGHLFFSLGERGEMRNAQDLSTPLGKIHRVNLDGSVPRDNPFVGTPGAVPTIWSYGHRNPQGLAFDPASGLMWETEHGPAGGDEVNVIEPGHNYGWGVASMGVQPGITRRSAPGMDDPVAWYTPRIAPSGIAFYAGDRYPGWRGSLFIGGLAGQQLRRLEVRGRDVVDQEVVFDRFGRVREVVTGPDGLLYVLLQIPTGGAPGKAVSDPNPGMVARLVPLP